MRSQSVAGWMALLAVAGCVAAGGAGFAREGADLPVMSQGDLRFFVDAAAFRGPEGYTRQEVYMLIDARQLLFLSEGKHSVGNIRLTASVADTGGAPVAEQAWTRVVSMDSLNILMESSALFRDAMGFDLRPGEYRLRFAVEDLNSERRGVCETTLRVPDFEGAGLIFSDLQFASAVERSGQQHRFVKQGWKVTPNTTRRYLPGQPLSVYFELYNFSVDAGPSQESFILGYSLVDSSGQKVREYPARRILKPGESCVKTETLDTEGLVEGAYQVQVEAYDGSSRQYLRKRRPVFLVSGGPVAPLTRIQQDLLRYYMDIRYVADEKTLKAYRDLHDWPSRMKFLRGFWKSQDPTPATPDNERLLQHMVWMSFSENRFQAAHGRRGSDTDKGRVYVQYGPPDDILYHTSAAGQKPYEIWIYDRGRRYEFFFRDRRGNGVFDLVHSTYPGERYNPYWQDEL